MKTAILCLMLCLLSSSDGAVSGTSQFKKIDAEKVLGQYAYLADSSTEVENSTLIFKCTYTAVDTDAVSGKLGNLYCMSERYPSMVAAHGAYSAIRRANEKNGIVDLDDLGDESYFHTDGQNFAMIIAREDATMIRMKVNKKTSKTSPEALKEVAREIVATL